MRSLYGRINTEKVKHMKWEMKQIIIFFRLNALGGEFLPMGDGVVLHNTCIVTIFSLYMKTCTRKSYLEN